MSAVLLAFLVGTLGGPLGGLAAALAGVTVLRRTGERFHAVLLAFAGGFILSVAHLELLGRALEDGGTRALPLIAGGFLAGAVVRGVINRVVGEHLHGSYQHTQAWRIAVSLGVVNLLEGLPVGAGFAVGTGLGLLLAAVMVFENFMEGITVSTELAGARSGRWSAWLLPTVPTATLGVGAAAGAWLGGVSEQMLPVVLAAGAGIMIYVVADDIVYDAHRTGRGVITTGPLLAGVLVGVVLAGLHR